MTLTQTKELETWVYGGSFNPPTLAHLAALDACLANPNCNDIIVMPSGDRFDKCISQCEMHRLQMAQLMVASCFEPSRVNLSTYELDSQEITQTYKTAEYLLKSLSGNLRFVFGADSYHSMPNWQNGIQLQAEMPMAVISRGGSPIISKPNVINIQIDRDLSFMSSSAIRSCVAEGKPIANLVPKLIDEYIRANQLYVQ